VSNPTYNAIVSAVENYLKNNGHVSQGNPVSSKDLVAALKKMMSTNELNVDVTPSTILVYISKAANTDDGSGIISGGASGGYWYDDNVVQPAAKPIEETKIESASGNRSF
jgi:hypothetical protein